jgi:hypothetical protein
MALQLAKWPYQWLAVFRALRGVRVPYAVTPKAPSRRRVVLWPHWLVAMAMAAALLIGLKLHQRLDPSMAGIGVLVVAISSAIATGDFFAARPPWEPSVYRERRFGLSDLLGPPRWPSVERRRYPRVMAAAECSAVALPSDVRSRERSGAELS